MEGGGGGGKGKKSKGKGKNGDRRKSIWGYGRGKFAWGVGDKSLGDKRIYFQHRRTSDCGGDVYWMDLLAA